MDNNSRLFLIGKENPDGSLNGSMQAIEALAGASITAVGDKKERNILTADWSNRGFTTGAKNYDVSMPLELKGAGMDGPVIKTPEMAAGFLAAGMRAAAAAILTVSSVAGTFAAGEPLTNTTATNALGTVAHVVDNGDTTYDLWIYDLQNMPSGTDAISGDTSTATATVDSADDSICYIPNSNRLEHTSAKIHAFKDGIRFIGSRSFATFDISWEAGETATINFNFKTLYESPEDQPKPSAVFSDVDPLIGESAGLSIEGYPTGPTIGKLSISMGNEIVPVKDINSAHGRQAFRIKSRKITGGIDPEVTELSSFNPYDLWENNTKSTIWGTLGSEPGERVSMVVTKAQFDAPKDKERDGNDAYDMNFEATGQNDNDLFIFFH